MSERTRELEAARGQVTSQTESAKRDANAAKERTELKEANAEIEQARKELDSERKDLEAARAEVAALVEAVQRQEKAAKIREMNLTKLHGETTEAQSLLAGANKSLNEGRAALQRDESKLARREKQIEDHGRELSAAEKG